MVVGKTHISEIDFQQKDPVNVPVQFDECVKEEAQNNACTYNITVVHKSIEENHLFMCGNNGKETTCCVMNVSEHSATCSSSDKVDSIRDLIIYFNIKDDQASVFVESSDSADLYIADSGSKGIHRLGKHRVKPAQPGEEQHYVKLIVSKQGNIDNVPQDKVYGFYKVNNTDMDMHSDAWKSYVTQICMTDTGGPKSNMQHIWTSQLHTRLFCGDLEQRQHFCELLDIVTVEGKRWQDTTVYGLFQNEWGMRAVCVYTIQDIDHVFKTSPFKKSDLQLDRPRMCVADSTKLDDNTLKQIMENREMEKLIQPVNNQGPILISHHHYTHIAAHKLLDKRGNDQTLVFLSLRSGAVHKFKHKQSKGEAFIIAEYKPFNHRGHVVSMGLNPSTKTLYVTAGTEVVQVDVGNCQRYGKVCEECVLARDPYCGWSHGHCSSEGTVQDTEHGNISMCANSTLRQIKMRRMATEKYSDTADPISVVRGSQHFFQCPVSSLHAQYSWYHNNRTVPCNGTQQQCLLLLPNVQPEQEGSYSCESEEQGYRQVLAQYQLRVRDSAEGHAPGRVLGVTLMTALLFHS